MAILAAATLAALATGVRAVRMNRGRAAVKATVVAAAPPPAVTIVPAPIPEPALPAAAEPEPAKALAPATSDDQAIDAKALRDEALELLKKAKNSEAMVAATKALEADPSDAMPYLVLGSALQDAGRWREATRAYQICAKTAKRGMVDECRAMLRRR
jgi:Flp pilus assembly protein TadD